MDSLGHELPQPDTIKKDTINLKISVKKIKKEDELF